MREVIEVIESAEEFVRLRRSSVQAEYHRAAHEEAAPGVWLDVIARHPDMKRWVAHNKSVPVAILETLSTDPDSQVRWTVASKRKLTAELFVRLAADEDESVRHRIAHNPKVPSDVLDTLAYDSAQLVREAARRKIEQSAR